MGTLTIYGKSHSEWLKAREGGIGSSDVAAILGVSPYTTPYQLWLAKTGQVAHKEEENFLMKAGHYLEDAISHFCADDARLDIVKNSAAEFVVVDKEKPFMRVSPDRYAFPVGAKHSADNKSIVECKSTQKPVDSDDIPKSWFVQVEYQMHVTRIRKTYLAWLTQGRDFGYKPLNYDADLGAMIEEVVEQFWVDCVVGGKEPALTTVGDVLIKYPKHSEGKKVIATDELVGAWSELKDTNAEIKRLEAVKEALEEKIKTAMLDAESLVVAASQDSPERTLATWKASKPSMRFNADALKAEQPEVYAKYLSETAGSRRFSCK